MQRMDTWYRRSYTIAAIITLTRPSSFAKDQPRAPATTFGCRREFRQLSKFHCLACNFEGSLQWQSRRGRLHGHPHIANRVTTIPAIRTKVLSLSPKTPVVGSSFAARRWTMWDG